MEQISPTMSGIVCADLDLPNGVDVRMISTSPKNRKGSVALASRQGLWIASPTDSYSEVDDACFCRCQLKDAAGRWQDFGCVSWGGQSKSEIIAASSQKIICFWDLDRSTVATRIEIFEMGHRAITDLDWSLDLLASAAMDGSISIYDYRDVKAPSVVMNSRVPGFGEVRCNKIDQEIIASAHSGQANCIKLWDLRQPSRPFSSIVSHASGKLGRFDWSPKHSDEIASCSPLETSAKIWRINISGSEPHQTIPASADVCAVKYDDEGERMLIADNDGRVSIISLQHPYAPLAIFHTSKDVQKDRKVEWFRGFPQVSTVEGVASLVPEIVSVCPPPSSILRCWALCPDPAGLEQPKGHAALHGVTALRGGASHEACHGAALGSAGGRSEERELFEALGRLQQGEARVHVRNCARDAAYLEILIGGSSLETHPTMHLRLRKPWLGPPGSRSPARPGRPGPDTSPPRDGRGIVSAQSPDGEKRCEWRGGGGAGAGEEAWAAGVRILTPSGRGAAGVRRRMVDALRPTRTDRTVEALLASMHGLMLLQDECDALFWELSDSSGDGGSDSDEPRVGPERDRCVGLGRCEEGRGAGAGVGWACQGAESGEQGEGRARDADADADAGWHGGPDAADECDGGDGGGTWSDLGHGCRAAALAPLHPLHTLQARLPGNGPATAPAHTHGPPYRGAGAALGPDGRVWLYRRDAAAGSGRDSGWQSGAGHSGWPGRAGKSGGPGLATGGQVVAVVELGGKWAEWGAFGRRLSAAYHLQPCGAACRTCGMHRLPATHGGVPPAKPGAAMAHEPGQRGGGPGSNLQRPVGAGQEWDGRRGPGRPRRDEAAAVRRACEANAAAARSMDGWGGAARVWELLSHVAVEGGWTGRWSSDATGRLLLAEVLGLCCSRSDAQTGATPHPRPHPTPNCSNWQHVATRRG